MSARTIHGARDRMARDLDRRGPACTVPACRRREPPADGCSHVDCPNRRRPTALPGRDGDGPIPRRPPAP